jgi:hypothetical protein
MPHQTKGQHLYNTKVSPRFRVVTLLALGLVVTGVPAGAQTLGNDSPTNDIAVTDQLTYLLSLTNSTAFTVWVSNTLSGPVQVQGYTSPIVASISNSTLLVFAFDPQLPPAGSGPNPSWTITIRPTGIGFITNTVSLYLPSLSTNVFTTNIVNQVTNAVVVTTNTADLAISMSGPTNAVYVNDWVTIGMLVTNRGPDLATNVTLSTTVSNPASAWVIFGNLSPTNLPRFLTTNGVLQVDLGTLTNRESQNLALTVQPTNAGPLTFFAAVDATGSVDPDPTNNTAQLDLYVYLAGKLVVTNFSAQELNYQIGLMEQTVWLFNVGTTTVASAQVEVSGLTATNWLFNAAGTNNGTPYVVYADSLLTNQGVPLRLQYFVHSREPFPLSASQVKAFEVPQVKVNAPTNPGTFIVLTNGIPLPSGDSLVQFPSVLGSSYTVVYEDNDIATNARVILPSIVAYANWVQWIDYGPPATFPHPTNVASRLYRVYLNP